MMNIQAMVKESLQIFNAKENPGRKGSRERNLRQHEKQFYQLGSMIRLALYKEHEEGLCN